MITVSTNFKEAVKNPIRKVYAEFTDGVDPITAEDDLKFVKLSTYGDIGKAIMRKAEVGFFGSHNYEKGNVKFGVYVADVVAKGTVTISVANPAVVTLNAHGLSDGNRIKLSTTGSLPTGLSVDTSYYVIKINDNTFNLATTFNDAMTGVKIATSGTQSGTHSLDYYEAGIGSTPEQIDMGTFYVYKKSVNVQEELTTLFLYDKMYEALVVYNNMSLSYPVTLKQVLDGICADLGWTLATTTFPNDDMSVSYDYFAFQGKTYRDVLNQIAEATGTIMYFNSDDELVLKTVGGASVEEITAPQLYSIDPEDEWGDVNSIVLRNNPVDTNWVWYGGYYHRPFLYENGYPILLEDGTKLRTERLDVRDDLYQIRIDNNAFIGENQETYMTDLVTALMGFSYIPFSAKTTGLGYFEIGDTITLTDHNSVSYVTTVLDIEIEVSVEGFSETLFAEDLELGLTNVKKNVDVIEEQVKKTVITGENLEDDTVGTAKIKDAAIDTAKIKDAAIDTAKIKDAAVTNAKIDTLAVNKLTTGTLSAVQDLGGASTNARVTIDGVNNRIMIRDESAKDRILIGRHVGGF